VEFKEWLESQGCDVVLTQEDDGSGYYCLDVTTPELRRFTLSVDTDSDLDDGRESEFDSYEAATED
jgi:hypothetical protein